MAQPSEALRFCAVTGHSEEDRVLDLHFQVAVHHRGESGAQAGTQSLPHPEPAFLYSPGPPA